MGGELDNMASIFDIVVHHLFLPTLAKDNAVCQ
jgi:hypothetical protein